MKTYSRLVVLLSSNVEINFLGNDVFGWVYCKCTSLGYLESMEAYFVYVYILIYIMSLAAIFASRETYSYIPMGNSD